MWQRVSRKDWTNFEENVWMKHTIYKQITTAESSLRYSTACTSQPNREKHEHTTPRYCIVRCFLRAIKSLNTVLLSPPQPPLTTYKNVSTPGGGYSLQLPIRGGSARKGYHFHASSIWKGRDFTSRGTRKGTEIYNLVIQKGLSFNTYYVMTVLF